MNCEIIIAARGELPENLRHTVESIRATCGKHNPGIHVVFDGKETVPVKLSDVRASVPWDKYRGCGACRHYGITQSTDEVIVICDGHMDFPAGWLDKIMAHHQRNKNTLTCCRMRSVGKGFVALDDKIYAGAFIAYKKAERSEGPVDYHALKGTWNPDGSKAGPVGCVMGACYAFRRDWYETIGQPLALCDEWGQDEELLSLGTHFMGGRVICLDPIVGHYYAAPNINRASAHPEAIARRVASRFVVLSALPIEDEERLDLEEWIRKKPRDYDQIIAHTANRSLESAMTSLGWRGGPRTWADLKAEGIVRPCTEAENKQAMGFRAIPAKDEQEVNGKARISIPDYRETYVAPPIERCDLCNRIVVINPMDRNHWRRSEGYSGMRTCPNCNHKQRIKR